MDAIKKPSLNKVRKQKARDESFTSSEGLMALLKQAIDIGDDVFTGMNVYITDQNHGYEELDTPIGRQLPSEDPVTIGADSWIGSGAVILPGAKIGRHVVVGANSVVRGEFPDFSVVVGVPGRVVRRHDGTAWRREGEAT